MQKFWDQYLVHMLLLGAPCWLKGGKAAAYLDYAFRLCLYIIILHNLSYYQKFKKKLFPLFCSWLAYAVLSDKKKRRLYDNVGHEAFLENQASFEAEDDDDETSFHFSFSDIFQDFHDSPFLDEPRFHWSFLQEVEEEDFQNKHYSFEESTFSFYFDDENDEEHYY